VIDRPARIASAFPGTRARSLLPVSLLMLLACSALVAHALAPPPTPPVSPVPSPDPLTGNPRMLLLPWISAAEAYYADHHTYQGMTRAALAPYGVDTWDVWYMRIYPATANRYCIELGYGFNVVSQAGPLARPSRRHCGRLAALAAPAPHDGKQPDLPVMPRQAPIRAPFMGAKLGGQWVLDPAALALNEYWISHRSYVGATRRLFPQIAQGNLDASGPPADSPVVIVRTSQDDYCIQARYKHAVTHKDGPGAPVTRGPCPRPRRRP
jgi:hypothetical protein